MASKYSDIDILDDDSDDDSLPESRTKGSKAWRSIERYRELKELRQHLDDYMFDDYNDRNFNDMSL